MKKLLTAVLALAGGFLGGLLSPLLVHSTPASATGTVYQGSQLWILGPDGKQRIQMGTYTAGNETGQPAIGLTDNSGRLRYLFRLAGSNDSPVLVMKDKGGRDRLVMGLGLNDAAQEPFIATFDSHGEKHMVTGTY